MITCTGKNLGPICRYCFTCTTFGQLLLLKSIKIGATKCSILWLIIEKKLQFITLLTAICIVSHIENSKNDKGYIT